MRKLHCGVHTSAIDTGDIAWRVTMHKEVWAACLRIALKFGTSGLPASGATLGTQSMACGILESALTVEHGLDPAINNK